MEAVDRSVLSRGRGGSCRGPVSPTAASGIAEPLAGEVDGLAAVPCGDVHMVAENIADFCFAAFT